MNSSEGGYEIDELTLNMKNERGINDKPEGFALFCHVIKNPRED